MGAKKKSIKSLEKENNQLEIDFGNKSEAKVIPLGEYLKDEQLQKTIEERIKEGTTF